MANTFCLLGDIEFEVATGPRTFNHSEQSSYSEHDVLDSKPTLQWNGDRLQTIDLEFRWHYAWCNPDEQLLKLRKARVRHQPLTLVLGNGTYQGAWVIESIEDKLIHTDDQGQTETIEARVRLKETADLTTTEPKKGLAVKTKGGGLAAFARQAPRGG